MADKVKRTALLVNQDAKRVPAKMRQIHKLAKAHRLKLRLCDGTDLDHEIRIILESKKYDRLIIGGGDGTISKAAGLITRTQSKMELAVLPLGTANYYSQSLGIVRSLAKAFDVALSDKIERRHLCKANSRYFLIGVNVGTTSRMFDEVTDDEKKRFGKLAYFGGIARSLVNFRPTNLTVKTNGITYKYKSTELVILNQYIQEPVKLMPDVKGTDPYFEIITYGLGISKLSPLFGVIMFAISLGRNQKYLTRIRATEATIDSSTKHPIAIDGDSLEELPLKVSLVKRPVTFVRA